MVIQPATKEFFVTQVKNAGLWYSNRLSEVIIAPDILHMLDKETVELRQIMPVGLEQEKESKQLRLILATDRYQSLKEQLFFENLVGMPVTIKITDSENIKQGILHHYNVNANRSNETAQAYDESDDAIPDAKKSAIVEKVERIIIAAINEAASDIHLLPGESGTYVLVRIDGRLVNYSAKFPIAQNEIFYLVNVIKQMCTPPLEVARILLPDNGSIKWRWNNRAVDLRVSTMPTIRGQKVVIRILNSSRVPLDLTQLGFLPQDLNVIKKILMMPSGLFIVSGPVGTGKSTTIHAALKLIRGLDHNAITIENPVEHKDELLTQIEMRLDGDEKMQLTGERIFDSILRQDPETIFYTETRNKKDAALLIRASLSGHRIFTTLHARNAISSLYRLFDMDVNKADLLRELNGVLSQRLLAVNCPRCAKPYKPTEQETLLLTPEEIKNIMSGSPKRGSGCAACHEGYNGRIAVAETLLVDDEFRDFILHSNAGIVDTKNYLREKRQFRSIWVKGLDLVREGKVSLAELIRVVPPGL